MSDDKLEIEVVVNGKRAIKQLENIEQATDSIGKQSAKTDKQIKSSTESIKTSWLAVGAAVAAVTGTLAGSTRAYAQQLKAETALRGALKANYTQGQDNISMWKEYASMIQENTLFGDELILQQLSLIKAFGLTDDQMKSLIEASVNLSAATGESLESSVRNLAKTYSGLGGELSEKIPQLRELTAEQLKQGEAISLVNNLFADQAKNIADTDYGKMVQAYNDLGDAMETIGELSVKVAGFFELPEIASRFAKEIQILPQRMLEFQAGIIGARIEWNKLTGDDGEVRQLEKDLGLVIQAIDDFKNNIDPEDETLLPDIEVKPILSELEKLSKARKEAYEILEETGFDMSYPLTMIQKEADAVKKAEEQKQKAYEETKRKAEEISGDIADSILDTAMTGKLSFADMANAMIREMFKVYMQRMLLQPVMGFLTGGFGGLFHTGGEVKHTGGMIGANVPSYHTGMRSDERMAKLQVGESVINRHGTARNAEAIDAMNKGLKVGGDGGGSVTTAEINFNVQAIDASSFNSFLVNNKSTIEGIINNSLRTNGSVRKTIKMVG